LFAFVYYLIGMEHLGGITLGSPLKNFGEAFFFSAQTFTTVGYGRINPSGFLTSSIAAVEALTGLLSFAVVTGLFYGRFSRPRAFLKFSQHMVLAPFRNKTALMFRMVPYKNNRLTEAEVKLTLAIRMDENGNPSNKFYTLDLDISKINTLSLSWTVVHPIDDKSPLYQMTEEDIKNAKLELLVFVKAFDEVFSNTVIGRTSYDSNEIIFGARFRIMYEASPNGQSTILHLDRLNAIEKVPMPFAGSVDMRGAL
ncbi:MAG TPA: ion channel, partial [Chitinophagaceae bacterium]|nr:ion channel [Chitinophagaceae bacterium]